MKRLIMVVCLVLCLVGVASASWAQGAATPPPAADHAAKPPAQAAPVAAIPQAAVPTVSDQDQQVFALMGLKAQVQAEMLATIQKELDSTNAELGRLAARLRKDGYDLTRDQQTGRLAYVPQQKSPADDAKPPKPESKEPKK